MTRMTGGIHYPMKGWAHRHGRIDLRFAFSFFVGALFIGLSLTSVLRLGAAELFDEANKLYEERQFQQAAKTYQKLIDEEGGSSTLYFNLGNAYFKADQIGRAIAAYQLGRRLDPRDPSLRFNLQFAQQQVTGNDSPSDSLWRRAMTGLTMNEWTLLFVVVYWIWFVVLCLREIRPAWRRTLRGYTATAGVLTVLLGGCLGGAWQQWFGVQTAVVVVQETLVRYGPLDESQVNFQLRDGSEVTVLDRKVGAQSWLQVRDAASREGWLKADDVIILQPAASNSKTL